MADRIRPSARQLEFQQWERGIFLHFGLRTFYEGYKDFDTRGMDPAKFNPTALDCDQWVTTAKQAGFNYMVMTAKHHDGFAVWPSKTTEFSVAASAWKDGQGDVVREFIEACRRHDVHPGLYYSPFDAACPVFGDEKAYDDFFITQISEILEPYGPIDVLWFDGCGSEGHTYDWPRIVGEIRRMQPGVLIFNMGDPDIRWIGNEHGYAPLGTSNEAETVPFSIQTDQAEAVERKWLCPECDCRMRERNWFYSDQDEDTVKSLDELMGIYYYSCGRNANLLLNIGPDRRGMLPDKDTARLLEFGREIDRRVGRPFATLSDCGHEGAQWTYKSETRFPVDHAVIVEDIAQGERIRRFAIKADMGNACAPITLYEGRCVGRKAVCPFPTIRTHGIWLEVIEAEGDVQLASLEFHWAGKPA